MTTPQQRCHHMNIILLMYSRILRCLFSSQCEPRGEVAVNTSTGKARPRGLLPTSSKLDLSSPSTLTSTPPHRNAAKTRLHVVQRHIYVRGREHLRPRLLPRWPDQSRRNSLPTYYHRETQHLQPPRINFKLILHYCGLCDDDLTSAC